MSNSIILTCSPRVGGNTDTAGELLCEQLNNTMFPTELITLRSLKIRPCISCGFCDTHAEQCSLEAHDEVGWLFDKVRAANTFIIISPIFFYGPPAQLKSFIDRAQKYWHHANYALDPHPLNNPFFKSAFVILIGARNKGQHLFTASLLILKAFFQCIGFSLQNQLLLQGFDGLHDLLHSDEAKTQISLFSQKIQSNHNNFT